MVPTVALVGCTVVLAFSFLFFGWAVRLVAFVGSIKVPLFVVSLRSAWSPSLVVLGVRLLSLVSRFAWSP